MLRLGGTFLAAPAISNAIVEEEPGVAPPAAARSLLPFRRRPLCRLMNMARSEVSGNGRPVRASAAAPPRCSPAWLTPAVARRVGAARSELHPPSRRADERWRTRRSKIAIDRTTGTPSASAPPRWTIPAVRRPSYERQAATSDHVIANLTTTCSSSNATRSPPAPRCTGRGRPTRPSQIVVRL